MSGYRLYPTERPWWSFADYGALLAIVQRIRPQTVLEFGPGSSTLALVEGGAGHVEAFEDDDAYLAHHRPRFAGLPVTLRRYIRADPLSIPEIGPGVSFDLAFVDGPRGTHLRAVEIRYALDRCAWVACHDALADPIVEELAYQRRRGWNVEIIRYDRNPGEPHAIGLIGPPA